MSRTNQRVAIGLSVLALVVLALFVGFNFQEVEIDFVVITADVQLAFALILAALLGFLAGMVTHAFRGNR